MTKQAKYKGKICSPDGTHQGAKKSTRKWCKGQVGIEHDWWWFETTREKFLGLAAEEYLQCRGCGEQPYKRRPVFHSFGTAVRAARLAVSWNADQLAKALDTTRDRIHEIEDDANSPSLKLMTEIAEVLSLELEINLRRPDKDPEHYRWFNSGPKLKIREVKKPT